MQVKSKKKVKYNTKIYKMLILKCSNINKQLDHE